MRHAPDDRIGNYRIERELGSTSTGVLYQAAHVVLPRRAVLKITSLPPFAKQVLREACILEALRHPGVPQVYESGLLVDRRPWFAVEQMEGVALVERIAQGPLTALDTALLVRDIAGVLEHAHRRGVVHRGLRPDRIVLTPRRRFPISMPDWSEARTHDAAHPIPHVPAPGARHYVAPELVRGDGIDDRADIYALGVIGVLALTGQHPTASRRSTRELAPDAPRELAQMLDQMLATDRYDRPSAAEVRGDLDWLAAALSSDAAPVAPIEDVVLVDTEGVPAGPVTAQMTAVMPRIRRPRWTPPYATHVPSENDAVVIDEIDDVTSA